MGGHVFISYSHADDGSYAQALAAHLKEAGLNAWLDNEIITGDRWEHTIREKIDTCAVFVVLMSPAAEASDWVAREIHRAETKAKPILPLLLEGDVFFRLSNIQYEHVGGRRMPSAAYVDRLRALTMKSVVSSSGRPVDPAVTAALADIADATQTLRDIAYDHEPPAGTPSGAGGAIPRLIRDFALAEVARITAYLRLVGRFEDLSYDGEDRDWLLALTRASRHSIEATSLTTSVADDDGLMDGGLWASDLGRQYLAAQRRAIERGVRIRRIFIVDQPQIRQNLEFAGILRTQSELGIQVRTLYPDDFRGRLQASVADFIIFDNVLSYHINLSPTHAFEGQAAVITTTLVTDTARLRNRIDQYHELWNVAAPWAG